MPDLPTVNSMPSFNRVQLRVGALPPLDLGVYSALEIDLIEDRPGWYCWIHVPDSDQDLRTDLLRFQGVHASIEGFLGAKYEGDLPAAQGHALPRGIGRSIASLQATMLAFGPPLYIGIAKRLRSRLRQHKHHLDEALRGAHLYEPAPVDASSVDSDKESAYFGGRIGQFLLNHGVSVSSLFIRCVEAQVGADLKSVETALNRLYCPPFGRKA